MKIVFLGEDSFSAVVLESLILAQHQILAVFCPYYDNKIHARLKLICDKNEIAFNRVIDINSEEIENALKILNPDLIAVCHFQKILKNNIIQTALIGCINLHPSLLPYYRGMSPQHWPIINGDEETGITVHYINEGVDTGDIILQYKISIAPNVYVSDLQRKMLSIYKIIVKEAIDLISNNNVKLINQNHLTGSYFGRLRESHCLIDINGRCINAYNLIRGVSMPYFGAKYHNFRIWKAAIASEEKLLEIEKETKENGICLGSIHGDYIKFSDGALIIKKYSRI